jgi:hypothetical protein
MKSAFLIQKANKSAYAESAFCSGESPAFQDCCRKMRGTLPPPAVNRMVAPAVAARPV